jgi:nucleotide-binding universal stress UspA family protein
MAGIERIIYACDFSPASLAAFPHAVRLAHLCGAELTIFHVLPTPATFFAADGGYVPQEIWDDIAARARADVNAEVDRLVRRAVEAGVQASAALVDGDTAAAAIVKAATDLKAQLLVLGTHGRTGIAGFFLGSVAARVVATAPCPVLTVRAPAATEA